MSQARSIKAKDIKKGFKNNTLESDFKDVTLYKKIGSKTNKINKSLYDNGRCGKRFYSSLFK